MAQRPGSKPPHKKKEKRKKNLDEKKGGKIKISKKKKKKKKTGFHILHYRAFDYFFLFFWTCMYTTAAIAQSFAA
jgi:hypothetical protein